MYRHICQEVCPWNVRFASVAAERDYAARESWEAEWDRDDDDPEGEGPIEAVREGHVVEFEHLRIEAREDGVFYVAKPSRQPETAFKLAPDSGPILVFENPDHDFPTTIAYTPLGADSMRATIAGNGREVPFLYARAACGRGEAAGKSDDVAR